jgi:hemin uptake protein HemP
MSAGAESTPTLTGRGSGVRAYPVIPSSTLFAGKKEVRILHAGVEYVLRITKEQKLVLTK